jgi:hypothetical protein
MAKTPGGNPYPLGTEHVVDGDDAIHALATALDNVYNHSLPDLHAGGVQAPLTVASDLRWIHKGFRVSGAANLVVNSAGAPAGVWGLVLPVPCLVVPNALTTVGSGWIVNGGALILASLVVHPAGPAGGLVYVQGGSFSGYAEAVVPNATASFVFDYTASIAAGV